MSIFKNKYKNSSDADLVSVYLKDRNQTVMTELFKRYQYVIRSVCWKYLKTYDGDDIASEVFEKFILQIRQDIPNNLGGWIYTVSKNACLNQLRKQGKTIALDKQAQNIDNSVFEDEQRQNKETMLQSISTAMEHLKAGQKQCLELFYLKEMTYEDISKFTGQPIKSIKSCLQNGKRNVQLYIQKHLKQN